MGEPSTSSAFSSDGSRLALGGKYGLMVYDTADWTLVSKSESDRRQRYFAELIFIDNNQVVLAREVVPHGGEAGMSCKTPGLSLMAYKTDGQSPGKPVELARDVLDIAISPNGRQVVVLTAPRGEKVIVNSISCDSILTLTETLPESEVPFQSRELLIETDRDLMNPTIAFLGDGSAAMAARGLNSAGESVLLLISDRGQTELEHPAFVGELIGLRAVPTARKWLLWSREAAVVIDQPNDPNGISPLESIE